MIERARGERALREAHDDLERRVGERTATLQETISELESFSYSISHDLRAPLRAMQTYASILIEESSPHLPENSREYLRRIKVAADRMDRLIRDVLVFSRVARAQMPLERVELSSFISSVIESYPELRDAQAEIALVNPLPAVCANPGALTQCIANLLENALKFAVPGAKPKIRIWADANDDRVSLHVQDNGVGIPAELHGKIFGMFYQADAKRGGTGIGLAVVQKAVERMSGRVSLQSTPGAGTTFTVELPAANGA
jgi:signal transduction histidine kinase